MSSKKKSPPPQSKNNNDNNDGGGGNGGGGEEKQNDNNNASSPLSEDAKYMQQLDNVVELLQKKAYGEVTSAQVEAAVSGVLTNLGGGGGGSGQHPQQSSAGSKKKKTSKKTKQSLSPPTPAMTLQQPQIKVDNSNYDDDDENDVATSDNKPTHSKKTTKDEDNPKVKPDDAKSGVNDGGDDDEFNDNKEDDYADLLSQIPLGKEGAKMMTTFGDGPKPNLEAVKIALLGARKSLQFAIMDARAIRRRARSNYDKARQYSGVKQRKAKKHSDGADSVDPNMMFRVLQGGDRLGKNPKCGFDTEQLKWLFPEEMRSYQRWNDMHSEYNKTDEKAKGEGDDTSISETNGGDTSEVKSDPDSLVAPSPNPPDEPGIGGHLQARAANFDARTEKMKSDWYLKKFAKVRQGSFLPRGRTGRKTAEEADWEKSRKRKRGRSSGASWDSMSALNVRFLHWLGFDPPALCPPNDETTQALAFLGYDMLGKIVEKAIFIKNLDRMREEENQKEEAGVEEENKEEIDETKVLWELREGEQLSKEDIDKAMDDPDVRPSSFHTTALDTEESSSNHLPQFQLYFGPGFEQRLELEMEELVASEKRIGLSEEEIRIREEEALLFSKISSPPAVTDGLAQILEQKQRKEGTEGGEMEQENDGLTQKQEKGEKEE